jgi:hypothetical protein
MSLLDFLQGKKTKLAALLLALLALNEALGFLPAGWISMLVYFSGALGLYGLRDALSTELNQLKQLLNGQNDAPPPKPAGGGPSAN